jgi:hypothetical protein
MFGERLTYSGCCQKIQMNAQIAAGMLAEEQRLAQLAQQILPNGESPTPPLIPPVPPLPIDPMAQPAVSAADKSLMDHVRQELMKIEMQTCNACNKWWFDLDVKDGKINPSFQLV